MIWLPTPDSVVERMLTMAQVGREDVVYDLGSGDGRMVIAAAKRGAEAVGVEFNPDLVAFAEREARQQGVAAKARFVQGDIFATDFSRATVVTLYLLSTLNERLRPTILKMKPGTRVVSHAFTMGDWAPDETSQAESRIAYLWIVPAQVRGRVAARARGRPVVRPQPDPEVPALRGQRRSRRGRWPACASRSLRGDAIRFALRRRPGRAAGALGHGRRRAHGGNVPGGQRQRAVGLRR